MDMYLSPKRVSIYTIMIQGRWCSDTFLRYEIKQVQACSIWLNKAMLYKDTYGYCTVSDCYEKSHDEVSRLSNNPSPIISSFNDNNTTSIHTRNYTKEGWLSSEIDWRVKEEEAWFRSCYSFSFQGAERSGMGAGGGENTGNDSLLPHTYFIM